MTEKTGNQFNIKWIDGGRDPQCEPNPKYPDGIELDMSNGDAVSCQVALPYPAERCGHFVVECTRCGISVAITTAGRPDDPRSVRMSCRTEIL